MDEHRKEPISDDQAGAGAAASAADASAESTEAPAVSASGDAAPKAEAASEPAKPDAKPASEVGQHLRHGNVTIMAPARKKEDWYRHWDDEIEVEAPDEPNEPAAKPHGKRQLAVVAAAVILAAIAGAAGGALTSAGFAHLGDNADAAKQAQSQARTLDEQVSKLQTELAALKASVDRADKAANAQIAKAGDRIDKIEKAQAEPAQKIAKLSETVEKLRTAQAEKPAPAQVASAAAQDVTGSVPAKPAAKPDVGRLPTVEGWVLRDVYDGGAVIVGRAGTFEVYAGDPVPGLGRVDAIRRQDGRWVVVTSRGLIVAR